MLKTYRNLSSFKNQTISSKKAFLSLAPLAIFTIFLSITLWAVKKQESMDIREKAAEKKQTSKEEDLLWPKIPDTPEYAPSELIVKYKEGVEPTSLSIQSSSIKALESQYKVKSKEKVFKDTPSPQQSLQQLKAKLASSTGPSQQQVQKAIKAKEQLIARLERRKKRAPKGAVIPKLDNIYLLKTGQDVDVLQMVQDFSSDAYKEYIEYAQPNYKVYALGLTNDYYVNRNSGNNWATGAWGQPYEDMWGLKRIAWEQAKDISQGEGVIVAVIDTGVDYTHEDIWDNMWTNQGEIEGDGIDNDGNNYVDDYYGYDLHYWDGDPFDKNGHGTHCAGTIAGVANNNKGVAGVAPLARIMAVQGLGHTGYGWDGGLSDAIRYATDQGADILSNSWGGLMDYDLVIQEFIEYAYSQGVVIVAAAGNSNTNMRHFMPAKYPETIAVAAVNQHDLKCDFSNFGQLVDIAAPGGYNRNYYDLYNIISLKSKGNKGYEKVKISDKYARLAGTSMACPHVSGVAALLVEKYPTYTNEQIRSRIKNTADPLPYDIYFRGGILGAGMINAHKALGVDSTPKPSSTPNSRPTPPPTPTPAPGSMVIKLNEASGVSCEQTCNSIKGVCRDTGNDPQASNGKKWTFPCTNLTTNCTDIIVNEFLTDNPFMCEEKWTQWTNCKCEILTNFHPSPSPSPSPSPPPPIETPPTPQSAAIVLNSGPYPKISCSLKCPEILSSNFSCTNVGTDIEGINGQRWNLKADKTCAEYPTSCDTIIFKQYHGDGCNNYNAEWTNCRCELANASPYPSLSPSPSTSPSPSITSSPSSSPASSFSPSPSTSSSPSPSPSSSQSSSPNPSPTPNPACRADINQDKIVNILDIVSFFSVFGSGDSNADINDDGIVNIIDLAILLFYFGQKC